jgi:hypothetical protein
VDYISLQNDMVGYPLAVFYITAIIGILFILWRPFLAFLFAVFCLAGRNYHAAVLTRTEWTGIFLNLSDLLLWIALLAMFVEKIRRREKISLPYVLITIVTILTIGALQALAKYGSELFVLRSIWSVAIFPIMFLVSANMVKYESRAQLFYWALFMGSIAAAIQHMLFLYFATSAGIYEGYLLRIISYITSGGLYLIVISLFTKLPGGNKWSAWIYYPGIVLMAISVVMNQTRQLYIVFVLTIVAMCFVLKSVVNIKKTLIKLAFVTISVVLVITLSYSSLNLMDIVGERLDSMIDTETRAETSLTRLISMQTEINVWLDSTIIFGTGTAYPPEFTEPYREGDREAVFQTGALDHVAITSYLAHYGLIGVLIYLLFLPILTIKAAKRFISDNLTDYSAKVALLALTVALMDILNLFGSMLQTSPASHVPALIYGAIWGLYINKRQNYNLAQEASQEKKFELA